MIKYGDLLCGFNRGVVKLVPSPNGDGVRDTVCKIGDGWFHFGGQEAEACTPSEYLSGVGRNFTVEHIYNALNDVGGLAGLQSSDPDEYAYYEAVLNEAGCMGHIA